MLREKLTYSNVMATVAVFIAIGGTSYAAITCRATASGASSCGADPWGSPSCALVP